MKTMKMPYNTKAYLSGFGVFLYYTKIGKFYKRPYDSYADFVWNYINPLTWVVFPLIMLFVLSVLGYSEFVYWVKTRPSDLGIKVNYFYDDKPELLIWYT